MDHEGLDSEGDGTSPSASADETNLTNVADEFVRAHEGALIEVDIPPPPDPIEVGVGQVHRRIINPRLDQHSSTNVPIAVYLTPVRVCVCVCGSDFLLSPQAFLQCFIVSWTPASSSRSSDGLALQLAPHLLDFRS